MNTIFLHSKLCIVKLNKLSFTLHLYGNLAIFPIEESIILALD